MLYFIFVVLFATPGVSFGKEQDWDEKYQDVCKYDRRCDRIKVNGQWRYPREEIVVFLKEFAPAINKASEDFGVDPRAIVGSIITENSLNVSIADDIQAWLVKTRIASEGNVLGKQFSFGLGQIYLAAAMEAEPLVAKIEKRDVGSNIEVAEKLLNPEQSIRYVAAILRMVQDDYKEEGIDISNKPEILATLYNLGESKRRAEQTKASNKQPKVNYFGLFVEKNMEVIDDIVNSEMAESAPSGEKLWDVQNNFQKIRDHLFKKDVHPREIARRATKNIVLVHAPPLCNLDYDSDDEDGEYEKSLTYTQSKPSGTIQYKEGFRELSEYLDCDFNEWKLVESEDGKKQGWISSDEMKEKSRPSKVLKLCRSESIDEKKCIDEIKKIPHLELVAENKGSLSIRLLGKKGRINWMNPNTFEECWEEGNYERDVVKALEDGELAKLRKGVAKFKEKMCKIVSDCSNNPYGFIFSELNMRMIEDECSAKDQCTGNVDLFLQDINNLKIKKNPSWSDIKEVSKVVNNMGRIEAVEKIQYDDNEKVIDGIRENINYCLNVARKYPKSTKLLQDRIAHLDNVRYQTVYVRKEYLFSQLKEMCESLVPLYIEASEQKQQQDGDCTHCSNIIKMHIMPIGASEYPKSLSVSMDVIKSIIADDGQKDLFFAEQIEANLFDMASAMRKYLIEEDDCSYDPKLTAKLIDDIFKVECVKHIYVPDRWLVNHFARTKNRRMPYLKGFIENDRFEVNIQERSICTK